MPLADVCPTGADKLKAGQAVPPEPHQAIYLMLT